MRKEQKKLQHLPFIGNSSNTITLSPPNLLGTHKKF